MAKAKKMDEVLYEAESKINVLVKDGEKVLKSKAKGDKWCVKAAPTMVGLNVLKKWLEDSRKAACKPLKDKVKVIEGPVRKLLDQIEIVDRELRDRVLEEHEGGGTVHVEEVGDLVFSEKWEYEVEDLGEVEEELLTVDRGAVMELIKGGVRNIPGIRVYKTHTLSVCKPGTVDYAMKKALRD